MKISCELMQDLLPLYYDDICNNHSKRVIEEHLVDCKTCQNLLERMKNETAKNILTEERRNVVMQHTKTIKRKSFIFGGVTIAIFAITLLLMIAEIREGNNWFLPILIPTLYGIVVSPFLLNQQLKLKEINALTRAGASVISIAMLLLVFETLFSWIFDGVLRLRFSNANLFVWDNTENLNANIDLLILLTCFIVGGTLLGIGVLRQKSSYRK